MNVWLAAKRCPCFSHTPFFFTFSNAFDKVRWTWQIQLYAMVIWEDRGYARDMWVSPYPSCLASEGHITKRHTISRSILLEIHTLFGRNPSHQCNITLWVTRRYMSCKGASGYVSGLKFLLPMRDLLHSLGNSALLQLTAYRYNACWSFTAARRLIRTTMRKLRRGFNTLRSVFTQIVSRDACDSAQVSWQQ